MNQTDIKRERENKKSLFRFKYLMSTETLVVKEMPILPRCHGNIFIHSLIICINYSNANLYKFLSFKQNSFRQTLFLACSFPNGLEYPIGGNMIVKLLHVVQEL